jgi:hypothetical protein
LPEHVALGTTVEGVPEPAQVLRDLADRSEKLLGKRCEFALVERGVSADLSTLVTRSGYVALLDGTGYNRFGDESNLVRVIDATGLAGGKAVVRALRLWLLLYKGSYIVWPAIAIGRVFGAFDPDRQER